VPHQPSRFIFSVARTEMVGHFPLNPSRCSSGLEDSRRFPTSSRASLGAQ